MVPSDPAPTIGALVADARARLADPREAPILVGAALDVDRAVLYAHPERRVPPAAAAAVLSLVERRLAGEPVAYLLGRREFYGLDFAVGPGVLIPRPETELLVDLALELLAGIRAPVIADLGTGSGAIAVALGRNRPAARVVGVDRSDAALDLARENARRLGAGNVIFVHGDWMDPLAGRAFDLIVSNPPYVADCDPHLAAGDLRFEPRAALASGSDGLDALRRIISAASEYLHPGGWIVFEHGADQQTAVLERLAAAGFVETAGHADLAGLPRAVTGRRPER